jgi:D-glycero-D-manno-heptose 1,7-bisphosphate phosphatase
MSLDYDYHYVSTQGRLAFIKGCADVQTLSAYERLTDGAAQADIWRLLVLQHFGGVYMDIDAHLVFPLSKLIKTQDEELFISRAHDNNTYTNYLIATKAQHPVLGDALEIIKQNINSGKVLGVYALTGPVPFNQAINRTHAKINAHSYRLVCVQGSFTNEHFQYIDKPRGKWTHKKPEDILKKPSQKILFLDRDGVINQEKNYLFKIADFIFIDGVFEACLAFQKQGFKIIIITNQSGIGRGYYNEEDFEHLNTWVLSEFKKNGVEILDVFYCPHAPENMCSCRKPKPGMLLKAQEKYTIDAKNSWMIGDKENDITAANLAGITQTILVRSGHNISEKDSKASFVLDSIKHSPTVL